MAKPLLMVSIINNKVHLLELKHSIKSYQVMGEAIIDADQETVDDYAGRAGEIIINAVFSDCYHYWGSFPKVSSRYLKDIVIREIRQDFMESGIIRAALQDVGSVYVDGTPKRLMSCILVDDSEVADIENRRFGKFSDKISHISPASAGLCAAIANTENPKDDFMVITVEEDFTIIAISSAKGDVKVARHLAHLGFNKDNDLNNADLCKTFFREIEKEITTTSLHYLQNFQDSQCNNFYMLGSPTLELALERYGSDQAMPSIQFGFSISPLPSLESEKATEWAYIFSTLYCHRNYNLLNRQIVIARNFNRGYQFAMIAILVAIMGSLLYLYQIDPVSADKIAEYRSKNNQLEVIQTEVLELKNQVDTLNQFSGWENFYKNYLIVSRKRFLLKVFESIPESTGVFASGMPSLPAISWYLNGIRDLSC
ncbi:MAG: hypothetical protein MUD09_10155 [Desulfobacterales bacterium]|nr:hypothetical protein [Desulfobacterales bacterium]